MFFKFLKFSSLGIVKIVLSIFLNFCIKMLINVHSFVIFVILLIMFFLKKNLIRAEKSLELNILIKIFYMYLIFDKKFFKIFLKFFEIFT